METRLIHTISLTLHLQLTLRISDCKKSEEKYVTLK